MLTVISIFSSAFLVHGCEWPTDRKGIGLKNYDYVSDEEDSTDGKWVVRKPSWRSQEAILYFSNIVYISIREPKHQGRLRQIKRHSKINIGS